jgi:hypothetical protein
MTMKGQGGIIFTGKTEELREKCVPVPRFPTQIPRGLIPARTPVICGEGMTTNRLSHGTKINSSTVVLKITDMLWLAECTNIPTTTDVLLEGTVINLDCQKLVLSCHYHNIILISWLKDLHEHCLN